MSYASEDGRKHVYSNGSVSPYAEFTDKDPRTYNDNDTGHYGDTNGDVRRPESNGDVRRYRDSTSGVRQYLESSRDSQPDSRDGEKRREKVYQGYITNTTLEESLDGFAKNSLRPATRYAGGSLRSGFDTPSDDVDDHHRSSYMTDGIRQLPRYYPKYQTVISRDGLGPVYEDTPVSERDKDPLYSQPQRGGRVRGQPPNEAMYTMSMSEARPKPKNSLTDSQITGVVILCIFITLLALLAIALGVYFGIYNEKNSSPAPTTVQPPTVILDVSLYLSGMQFIDEYTNLTDNATVSLTNEICNALSVILKTTNGVVLLSSGCIATSYMNGSVIANMRLPFYKPDNMTSANLTTFVTTHINNDVIKSNGTLRSSLPHASNVTLTSVSIESASTAVMSTRNITTTTYIATTTLNTASTTSMMTSFNNMTSPTTTPLATLNWNSTNPTTTTIVVDTTQTLAPTSATNTGVTDTGSTSVPTSTTNSQPVSTNSQPVSTRQSTSQVVSTTTSREGTTPRPPTTNAVQTTTQQTTLQTTTRTQPVTTTTAVSFTVTMMTSSTKPTTYQATTT